MSDQLKENCLALLTEQGSLTDLMARLMGHQPVLNCLTQGQALASPEERQLLNLAPSVYSHIREITMGTEQSTWLFARTVIPLDTLRGEAKSLASIDKTPLGKLLFGDAGATRKNLKVDLITADDPGLAQMKIVSDSPLWQRRSMFQLNTGSLMITEIFLPDCPIYSFPFDTAKMSEYKRS